LSATCFFVSDLHGDESRYGKLFRATTEELPRALFLGGDLLPSRLVSLNAARATQGSYLEEVILPGFRKLRKQLGVDYPRVFIILGNDDARSEEQRMILAEREGLWEYLHERRAQLDDLAIYGYACVPPTPFRLKDWERYDVSRFVDPGCVAPEEGWHSVPRPDQETRSPTIQQDLERIVASNDASRVVLLLHAPAYRTNLDRAALDGKMIDHVPLDVHVGSIAIRRFIESRQPLLTLSGHIHESARMTGSWRDRIGRTHMFSAAHDGPELSLVKFDLENLEGAARVLV
jgi:Icc-related predicted phosphoesterase